MESFYVQRLVKEWIHHNSLIIACDVDDTIEPFNNSPEITEACNKVVSLLLECQKEGIVLIANTARSNEQLEKVPEIFKSKGLHLDSINKMPEGYYPYGHNGKVYANIYLDDRSGLELTMAQLQAALIKVIKLREIENNNQILENEK